MKQTTDKVSVQLLVDSFLFHGITKVVVSPGSRNAALIVGLAESGYFKMTTIVDERSAAFFALGMAQQTHLPVPLICTSGSALLNYAPAVAEAYYQRIPMLVVSADRPIEWIDQGDGQTIRQTGIYANFIDHQFSLPFEPVSDNQQWFAKREMETAINKAKNGPVHLNIPFEEPLYQKIDEQKEKQNNFIIDKSESLVSWSTLNSLKEIWKSCSKKMILVGQMPQNERLLKEIQLFLNDAETVVLDENLSNLKDNQAVHCIDRTLAGLENEVEFVPEILVSIGGAIVSKKIKAYLRKYKPQHHWRVGVDFPEMDTYQSLTMSIPVQPETFFNQLSEGLDWVPSSNFGFKWKQVDKLMEEKHLTFLETASFSDLKAGEIVFDCIPENSHLHLGNSSIIRYAQLFNPVRSIQYWCNRGTSGIDGSMSTAFGAAYADESKLHTLVLGDLSFFYDSNALWNRFKVPNLRIIVINNAGGGIFKIIPGPDTTSQLDEFFTTKHNFSAEFLCKAFDVEYLKADSEASIENSMADFYEHSSNNRPKLMEIFTPYEENDVVLKKYFKFLSSK